MHINGEWSKDYTKACSNPIGKGSFGEVWLVKSNTTNRYFAMKQIDLQQNILKCSIINKSYALDEGLKLKFLNISHPNIVKYFESYLHNEHIYWLMEYCDGGTLRDKISIYSKSEQPMNENLIWYWSLQLLSALKYLHSNNIIHRDLKPDNIYIENKTGSCKIGDFGLSKVLIDLCITDNTTIRFIRLDEDSDYHEVESDDNSESDLSFQCDSLEEDEEITPARKKANKKDGQRRMEEAVVYKLINLSQVGTPAYMPPEIKKRMRNLIETHLNYCSIESVKSAHRVCEAHLYKGDIFSFGCILYEMSFLKPAFENKFSLSIGEVFCRLNQQLSNETSISDDLKTLIRSTMAMKPEDRLNIEQLFNLEFIQRNFLNDYSNFYRQQVIPNLSINSKFARSNVLECSKVKIDSNYKPIAMKSLKYNQNLIVIIASKHVNKVRNSSFKVITTHLNNLSPFGREELAEPLIEDPAVDEDFIEESKIIVYDEFGQLFREFNSFLVNELNEASSREPFNFKINDLCIDEENDHLYLSTKKFGILRFKIIKNIHYLEDIAFNGRLDLSELKELFNGMSKCYPTCLNLIENEEVFPDTMRITNKRRLIFNDRLSKRIISVQVDLTSPINLISDVTSFAEKLAITLINCNIIKWLTFEQRYVQQMISTNSELICLFDDLNLVNVYDLRTLLFKRTNNPIQNTVSSRKNLFCLAVDSFSNVYSTDGECIFNLDIQNLKPIKRIRPLVKKNENLSHIISWMSLMTNSKLILLSDAVQMEPSLLFILNPVCKSIPASDPRNQD